MQSVDIFLVPPATKCMSSSIILEQNNNNNMKLNLRNFSISHYQHPAYNSMWWEFEMWNQTKSRRKYKSVHLPVRHLIYFLIIAPTDTVEFKIIFRSLYCVWVFIFISSFLFWVTNTTRHQNFLFYLNVGVTK